MQTMEMKMMRGKTLLDQILNNISRAWTHVEDIEKHLRKHYLRWLGHCKKINMESLTSRVYEKRIIGNKRRPKKT